MLVVDSDPLALFGLILAHYAPHHIVQDAEAALPSEASTVAVVIVDRSTPATQRSGPQIRGGTGARRCWYTSIRVMEPSWNAAVGFRWVHSCRLINDIVPYLRGLVEYYRWMSDPSNWRVLIVDDDPDNVGVLELVLGFHNAATRIAASGKECLRLLREETPTLLLVDIQMPGMTGYELLEQIRAHDAWRDLPVVAVTAHAMRGDADRIMRAGFDGYISKPVDVASLGDNLHSILEASKGTMMETAAFAERIRAHYPEGLTGILAIGGTRTAYILERRRGHADPGQIEDYVDYAQYTLEQYLRLIGLFFELGGTNLIIPPLSYQAFYERGEEYAQIILNHTLLLISEPALELYERLGIDPVFVGIDTLLHLPESVPFHALGARLHQFHQEWAYQPGRRKVIWEIAPIPLYSFWKAGQVMPPDEQRALAATLEGTTDMREMYGALFAYYARAALGTEIPVPHFYVGTNRNGDLKLRSMVPVALLAGGPFRLFYVPVPVAVHHAGRAAGHPARSRLAAGRSPSSTITRPAFARLGRRRNTGA